MNFDAFGASGMTGDFPPNTPFIPSDPLPPPPPLALDSALEEAQQWCNISIRHPRAERDLFCERSEEIPDFGLTSPSICLLETPPTCAESARSSGLRASIVSPQSSFVPSQSDKISPTSSRRGSHGVSDTDSSCSSPNWEHIATASQWETTAAPTRTPTPKHSWGNLKPQWETLAVHPPHHPNTPLTPQQPLVRSSVPSTPVVDFRALYEGAQNTIENLNKELARACARIVELESQNNFQQQRQQQQQQASQFAPKPSQPSLPISSRHAAIPSPLGISLVEPLPKIWYADRPFPQFEVAVNIPESLSLEQYKIKVGLVDGNGKVSEALGGQAQNHKFIFELDHSGKAIVNGLRITSVSSKCGGSFSLAITLITPHNPVCAHLMSDPIQVLSYRLFHSPKVDNSELSGNDRVFKIKGIGNLYAKRFMSIGIVTVADLAALDTGSNQCDVVLEHLRKDRGALTKAKFLKHIEMAREIVLRSDKSKKRAICSPSPQDSPSPSPPHSRKRVCV